MKKNLLLALLLLNIFTNVSHAQTGRPYHVSVTCGLTYYGVWDVLVEKKSKKQALDSIAKIHTKSWSPKDVKSKQGQKRISEIKTLFARTMSDVLDDQLKSEKFLKNFTSRDDPEAFINDCSDYLDW